MPRRARAKKFYDGDPIEVIKALNDAGFLEPNEPESARRYATPSQVEKGYGLGVEMLRKLRTRGGGPEYIRAGHRTILYDVRKLEAWLAQLPRSGGVR